MATATATKTKATAKAEAPAKEAPTTPREIALAAKVNATVTGPETGAKMIVQHRFRSGGVLLTSDGQGLYGGDSPLLGKIEEIPAKQLVQFEFVGGERDGQYGYLNRTRRDNRVVHVGARS